MRGTWFFCICIVTAGALLLAQEGSISSARIREDVRFLSSDAVEGRGVGERGGELATEYLARQLLEGGDTEPRFSLAGKRETQSRAVY